jgi:hypothetical protein
MKAYKHKGMKAPRPASYNMDETAAAKSAPKVKPSMQHKEPAHEMKPEMASKAPDHKKKALPLQDAPEGVKGVNAGSSHSLPKSGKVGESEV